MIRRSRNWRVELEANPRLVSVGDARSFGVHAVSDVTRKVGRARIGLGAFFYNEGSSGYRNWTVSGGVSIPLGGSRR